MVTGHRSLRNSKFVHETCMCFDLSGEEDTCESTCTKSGEVW